MTHSIDIKDYDLSKDELLRRLKILHEIGIALTSETDFGALLEKILSEAKQFTRAEGGTIFIREQDQLHFALSQNEKLPDQQWTQHVVHETIPISPESIAGYAASKGEIVNEEDVYDLPDDTPYRFNSQFDEQFNYRTKSLLAVPLQTLDEEVTGVLLLVNARNTDGSVVPFPEEEEPLVRSLASHAAVALENARRHREKSEQLDLLEERYERMQTDLQQQYQYENIVGTSEVMQNVYSTLDKVIPTSLNVIIEGETGTGKELAARAIHYNGPRKEAPFLAINCGRFSESLLESELFGHEEGAFTGASETRKGLFEQADEGTLFLDEISDMSENMQARLLRVLETQTIRRVGGERSIDIDVRILSASNQSLKQQVEQGSFREDLYYRLADARIQMPPLRARKEDIPLLVDEFLSNLQDEQKIGEKTVSDNLMEELMKQDWPGNVRQLRSTVRRMALFAGDRNVLTVEDQDDIAVAEPETISGGSSGDQPSSGERTGDQQKDEDAFEFSFLPEEKKKEKVQETLRKTGGNKSKAAEMLGISRTTLYKYIDAS